MINVAIIGTGLSAMSVLKAFENKRIFNIHVFEAGKKKFINEKLFKQKLFLEKSFKYNSEKFIYEKKEIKKKYNFIEKNFYVSSVASVGGLSNYWGGGIQVPSLKFYKKNNIPINIKSFENVILDLLNLSKKKLQIFEKIRNQTYYKFLKNYESESFSIKNLDISLSKTNQNLTLTSKDYFNLLKKNKKINLFYDNFVKSIKQTNNKYELEIIKNNKTYKIKNIDIVISCAGLIGSSYLVNKYLNDQKNKIKFHNNTVLQLCYFNPFLLFKKNNHKIFQHPLKKILVKNGKLFAQGSLIPLGLLDNKIFGLSKNNIFFNFLKKFFVVGNLFLDSNLSKNFIMLNKENKILLDFSKTNKLKFVIKRFKKIIDFNFKKMNFLSVPFLNFKLYKTGTDSHYTSSIFFYRKNGKKVMNSNCKIIKSKNFYVMDGSSIPPGMFYPTYFTMLNSYYNVRKIIKKYEKNK